jgi:hypothetical protein
MGSDARGSPALHMITNTYHLSGRIRRLRDPASSNRSGGREVSLSPSQNDVQDSTSRTSVCIFELSFKNVTTRCHRCCLRTCDVQAAGRRACCKTRVPQKLLVGVPKYVKKSF